MAKKSRLLCIAFIIMALSVVSRPVISSQAEYDLLITGGRIVDGTGKPSFNADSSIKNGRIVEIGPNLSKSDPKRAARVIDAGGLIVAPGFLDVHTHLEGGIEQLPEAENFLRMGVTSVVTGNCGGSALDLGEWFARL